MVVVLVVALWQGQPAHDQTHWEFHCHMYSTSGYPVHELVGHWHARVRGWLHNNGHNNFGNFDSTIRWPWPPTLGHNWDNQRLLFSHIPDSDIQTEPLQAPLTRTAFELTAETQNSNSQRWHKQMHIEIQMMTRIKTVAHPKHIHMHMHVNIKTIQAILKKINMSIGALTNNNFENKFEWKNNTKTNKIQNGQWTMITTTNNPHRQIQTQHKCG